MAKGGFPRGMGGGANMNQMLKQAQKMQEQMLKMQEEMEAKTYEAVVGGGAVKVVIDGKRQVQEVVLSPEVVDPDDIEMLQELIVAAVNEGLRKLDAESSAQLGSITGGLNIPGLF